MDKDITTISFLPISEMDCDLLQIAAIAGDQKFGQYVFPKKPISPGAAQVTKISVLNNKIYYMGAEVDHTCLTDALQKFSNFLDQFCCRIILVAYYGYRFDFPRLKRMLAIADVDLSKNVVGCLDTYPLMKMFYPGLTSYRQAALVEILLGKDYEAHNATADAEALQSLTLHSANEHDSLFIIVLASTLETSNSLFDELFCIFKLVTFLCHFLYSDII